MVDDYIIAADIGGTTSRFGSFALLEDGELFCRDLVHLRTGESGSFTALIQKAEDAFCSACDHPPAAVVLAVPGPVRKGAPVILPNIPFTISESEQERRFLDRKIILINDFAAQGYACWRNQHLATEVIQEGYFRKEGTMAVIGAGTGLGHCAIKRCNEGLPVAIPSEAGHAAFPFSGDEEIRYLHYLLQKEGISYPNCDLVVSGRGLSHLHAWLTGDCLEPEEIVRQIGSESKTTILFSRFYARACRNYALSLLATGGIFITGGIAMNNTFLVNNTFFRDEFADAGPYTGLLQEIPVSVVTDERVGLLGAAECARIRLGNRTAPRQI
ncbi:MAG: glucokinase [Methanocalculus sp. MSAO_Arc1]|uniref:glucokinase n=1 Tax=Methanocalculus TaxID=71151 RepID=UPI000FF74909|nr:MULTISPECIES: glucokinase [unclassified Methanocalculus]MCP1661513.1 glucokinase [Methanocalculus sp. AMF5]RQD80998.1 MAG: glucokinase [Methanocalculus sp. MSAO_Arc1]